MDFQRARCYTPNMGKRRDPFDLTPREGELYGKIHDATRCCIDGWGGYVASVCKPGSTDLLFENHRAMHNVHEEGFRRGDPLDAAEAYAKALKWLKKTARSRGLKLMLFQHPPEGHAGKVKLVRA